MYKLRWSKQAIKDKDDAERAGLKPKLSKILGVLERNPYEPTPGHRFEQLKGNLKGACSRRIDYNNRVIYTILPNNEGVRDKDGNLYEGIAYIDRAWGHIYKKPNTNKK